MKEKIELSLKEALTQLFEGGKLGRFDVAKVALTRPTDEQFGDYTTNIALIISKEVGMKPREFAEALKQGLESTINNQQSTILERIEIAGPGHINFFLAEAAYSETLQHILKDESRYGNSMQGDGEKVNNEFISANPTGPLHLGNGRGGFYADTLSRVLEKAGYDVTNEYYVNDAGEQVMKLGHSVLKDSEAVYGGEYIEQLATSNQQTTVRETGEWAAKEILEEMIKPVVQDTMRVRFDQWTSEKQVVTDGYVDKAINILKDKELTFEEEGALWLRTTNFGDDKDRVLIKKDGVKTYFASDCGYILNKMERGFTALIETWGADHHGYTKRFEAVARQLGFAGSICFTLVQMVRLMKDGEEVRMSKRAGNVVGIDELIETVGHDVARFFFVMYSPDTHMNFDLGLAEERSEKNPVYYVQYAYARLSSILRKAEESNLKPSIEQLDLLVHPKEKLLMRELMAFPELIERMAGDKTVHALPQYAIRLADRLHSFYADCQVVDSENQALSGARLSLIQATKIVLAETLRLIGVSAPEKM